MCSREYVFLYNLARMLAVVLTAVLMLLMAGCGSDKTRNTYGNNPENQAQSQQRLRQDVENNQSGESEQNSESAQTNSAKDHIQADEQIKVSMTCERLPEDVIQANVGKFGTPIKSTVVRVGEGNNTNEQWSIVVMDQQKATLQSARVRYFLTNALAPTFGDTWIELDAHSPWENVQWDHVHLIRGQSALEKAQQCFAE